eukprot:IDg21191t1
MGIPLNVLNAAVNLLIWATHTVVTRLSELVYGRLSARELSNRGSTTATDAAEISLASLLLGGAGPLFRRGRPWWAVALLLALAALLPLEIFVELGIMEIEGCATSTKPKSFGVCASPWAGHSNVAIAVAASNTQTFGWVDDKWDVVVQGSSKVPLANERPLLLFSFGMTVRQEERSATPTHKSKRIETVINKIDEAKVISHSSCPGPEQDVAATPTSARLYSISCDTDGVTSKDLARAVSLYRSMQMEKAGVRREGVNGRIKLVAALNGSDVTKALYALKSADWSDTCSGPVDLYSKCGHFTPAYVVPFFAVAVALGVLWIAVSCALRRVEAKVPHDAQSWREQAHKLMLLRESPERKRARSINGLLREEETVYESELYDAERLAARHTDWDSRI